MIGVRDYLENLGHKVDFDQNTGNVLVDRENGTMKSIGSEGFTLKDDGRYYAESEEDILNALTKSGISHKNGYSPLRTSLSQNNTVGYNDKTGQVYINGRDYNVDGDKLVKIGSVIHAKNSFINSLDRQEYKNSYNNMQERAVNKLLNSEYKGYNPEADPYYQAAYDEYLKDAKEDMGARGLTSDSLIAHYAAQGAEKLLPIYAEMDYERFRDKNQDLKDALTALSALEKAEREAYAMENDIRQRDISLKDDKEAEIANQILEESTLSDKEKEREAERELYEMKAKDESDMLDKEYSLKRDLAITENEMEKEILRLQNDLNISKAQATAYYKALYK